MEVGRLRHLARAAALLLALALPAGAEAHSFGRSYNLPVPLWLYAWGAAAALLLSFLLIGWFFAAPPVARLAAPRLLPARVTSLVRAMLPALRMLGVGLLLLTIASGFWGTPDPYRSFGMTWFWIVFVLGVAWATVLVGDLYAHLNPWAALVAGVARLAPGFGHGRRRYPPGLGDWPAFGLYLGFVAVELFGRVTPRELSWLLLGYTAVQMLGAWWFGAATWLRHGEFFAVFLRLLGLMSPLCRTPEGRVRRRLPFAGLLAAPAAQPSTLLFVLAMLATTAFDGLHATEPWFQVFWSEALAPLRELAGHHPTEAYRRLQRLHLAFNLAGLLLAPLLYLGAYLASLATAKALLREAPPLRTLALTFALSLLPIAFVYHLTHYFTLLLTQGPAALVLLFDPFGRGWPVPAAVRGWARPRFPDMAWVWHVQVGLILLGHVAAVAVAHLEALRLFGGDRRAALLSQLPMLVLMMGFTVAGLWILAQPITAG